MLFALHIFHSCLLLGLPNQAMHLIHVTAHLLQMTCCTTLGVARKVRSCSKEKSRCSSQNRRLVCMRSKKSSWNKLFTITVTGVSYVNLRKSFFLFHNFNFDSITLHDVSVTMVACLRTNWLEHSRHSGWYLERFGSPRLYSYNFDPNSRNRNSKLCSG